MCVCVCAVIFIHALYYIEHSLLNKRLTHTHNIPINLLFESDNIIWCKILFCAHIHTHYQSVALAFSQSSQSFQSNIIIVKKKNYRCHAKQYVCTLSYLGCRSNVPNVLKYLLIWTNFKYVPGTKTSAFAIV